MATNAAGASIEAFLTQYVLRRRGDYPSISSGDGIDWSQDLGGADAAEALWRDGNLDISSRVEDPGRERSIRLVEQAQSCLAPSHVAYLHNASVLPDSFIVLDQDNGIFVDSFRAFGAIARAGFELVEHETFKRETLEAAYLKGSYALLGIQTNRNYFHWLLEALPLT